MDYLLEVSRIIDGGLKGDRAKVAAYAEQLARKLRDNSDLQSAERIERISGRLGTAEVVPATATLTRLPVDAESRLQLADEELLPPEAIPLVLEPAVRRQVDEFIACVRAADRLMAKGVGVAPSMIISGPPGVGKTQLARFIAAQLKLPLLTSRSDSLISSFLGSTAKNLRMLFEHARSRPCVLFLDELDSVAKLRDDQHELGELKRVVVSLLQNVDALGNEVVLLGATNHPHLLDPAVWRRFAYRVELQLPTTQVRRDLFLMFMDQLGNNDDLPILVELSEALSGAQIRQICEAGLRSMVLSGSDRISSVEMIQNIARLRLGSMFEFTPSADGIKAVHDLSPRLFTCKRLAALFNTSEPTISRRLNEAGGRDAGRPRETADQDRDSAGHGSRSTSKRGWAGKGVRRGR